MQEAELEGDVVTDEWLARHGIRIPRATGRFQSPTAWVKTDARGKIVAAGENDHTVLAWLVETGTLGYSDIDYGIAYVTCRSAERSYRKQAGFKSCLDLPILSGGDGLSCEQAAEVFGMIRHELGAKFCQVIEYACDTIRSESTDAYKPPYRMAFSALARAFDSAVASVRESSKKQ